MDDKKMNRVARIERKTKETDIKLVFGLDGAGSARLDTDCHFLNHMLEQIVVHGGIDIDLSCRGDSEIDDHHSVEDIGTVLGQALKSALGEKKGIARFAHAYAPLDESLTRVVIDLSGRSFIHFKADFPTQKIGDFDVELIREFFVAFANNANITLHIDTVRGINSHHIAESIFKAFALALRIATRQISERSSLVPSSKGVL